MKFGLNEQELLRIKAVFASHKEIATVIVFGSRALNTFQPASDIDLALKGEINSGILAQVKGELEELATPYFFDVVDYGDISNPEFKAHIDRHGKIFYLRGWREMKLGDVAKVNPPETIAKRTFAKCVAMEGINPFTRKISKYELKEFNGGMKFRNGDTLLARITPCLENGKTSYVDILENNEVGFGSTEYIVIREKENLSDKKFLYYFSISPRFRETAIKAMTGTSGRQRVQTDLLVNKIFYLPPILEQRAIAAVLSSLDDKIELLCEQNKTLEATAQAIFKEWFVNFNFSGTTGKMIDSELGKIPEGWRVGKLSEIANFIKGLALQKYPPESSTEYLPVIKIKELNTEISEQTDKASTSLDKKYIVEDGDVLFSWSGSLIVDIWKHGRGALNQHLFKVTSDEFPKWFYFYWTKEHLPSFQQVATAKAVTMGHIKRHHLDDALVAIPNDRFMKVADAIFAPLLEKFINNNTQIQTLSVLRDALLPRLVKGEVRAEGFKA